MWKVYSGGALSIGSTTDRWTYDAFGRIKSVPGMVASQTYEADGQTKSITYANGVTTEFFYSGGRRWVDRIVTKNAAGKNLLVNQYKRDALGRITSVNGMTDADDWTYAYDDLDRLISATNLGDPSMSETFTYAVNDNLLSRSRNPAGQGAAAGTAPYVYTYPAGFSAPPLSGKPLAGTPCAPPACAGQCCWPCLHL